jgi:hypothetical protein
VAKVGNEHQIVVVQVGHRSARLAQGEAPGLEDRAAGLVIDEARLQEPPFLSTVTRTLAG